MPEISIILPVYNAEKYLKKCLDSISAQTFGNFKCICVNDCSSDNSLEILKEYADTDKRFKIITQKNTGASAARNTGLKIVSSPYLAFTDADDWVTEDYLEKLYTSAVRSKADITIARHSIYNNSDNVFKKETDAKKTNILLSKLLLKKDKAIKDIFKIADISRPVWGKLYKTDMIKRNNIYFFENIKIEEDFSFNVISLLYSQKITFVNNVIYIYRKQISSLTSNNEQLRIESLKSYIMLTKELAKRNLNDASANHLYINGFLRLTGKLSKNVSYYKQKELLNTITEHFVYLLNISRKISVIQKLKILAALFTVKILKEKSFNLFRILKNFI